MTTLQKTIVSLVVIVAIAGAYAFPRIESSQVVSSSAGTTFSTAKVAEQTITVATDTQVAILNTDASARTITGAEVFLTGGAATTTLYTIACATSSVATGFGSNTNYILKESLSIYDGTTTPAGLNFYVASSSPGLMGTSSIGAAQIGTSLTGNVARNWPSGSYLICKSTTTGGSNSNLFDVGMTGYVSVPYRGQ